MRQDPSRQIRGAFTRDLEAVLRTARGQAVQQVRDALRLSFHLAWKEVAESGIGIVYRREES